MDAKWTPGPHRADWTSVFDANGNCIAICDTGNDTVARMTANAHLYAAAATMAEALQNLIDRYVEVVSTPDCSCSPDDYDVQKARAALAKARGEA